MSRIAKILIFSLILIFSIYNKNVNGSLFDNYNENTSSNATKKNSSSNNKPSNKAKEDKPPLPIFNQSNQFDLESPDYESVPKSGYSPYNAYFGKGIYNDTDNYIEVIAPSKTHVVFIIIDVYSGRRIRNEFIRKGESFKMTKIPYGTYDYMYFTGRNWDNSVLINNGKIKGGFKDYQSFNKNQVNKDRMEFERGYYGGYRIKLTQSIGGNLETKSTTANDFFN